MEMLKGIEMKDIIIVCAGTYGKEALWMIETHNLFADNQHMERPYHLLGFIDDNLEAFHGTDIQEPIIGRISDWTPKGDEYYVIGTSSPGLKEKLTTLLKGRGCRFETLIAPWSMVSADCEMGEGCFITAYSISAGVKLGNFVNINGSMIAPGAVIDDYSTITGFSVVEAAHVGKRVFVGSHAVIPSGITVGDDAQISVGSIVKKDVEAGTMVFGVPAEVI